MVQPRPSDAGEELPLHHLRPHVDGGGAAIVRQELVEVGSAGDDALQQVGVDVGPRPTVGEGDRRRCEPMSAGVAATPDPRGGGAGGQLDVQQGAPAPAARVPSSVGADQHLGR